MNHISFELSNVLDVKKKIYSYTGEDKTNYANLNDTWYNNITNLANADYKVEENAMKEVERENDFLQIQKEEILTIIPFSVLLVISTKNLIIHLVNTSVLENHCFQTFILISLLFPPLL